MSEPALTIGVEEEYFLVDAETRALRPRAESVLELAQLEVGERVEPELNLAQVESSTPVCTTLEQVHLEVCRLRTALCEAATATGSRVAALGTHPFSQWLGQQITPKERYEQLEVDYAQLAWEQLVCGCHVHVGMDDPELAIAVMNHVRPHLPTLRALTTNSPFWQGIDTGYASFRMSIFDRWPTTGAPPLLTDRAHYDDLVASLVASDTIPDATKLYWDVRPSEHYPTLEFRVADVCLTVDETVMLTGLVRALVRTAVAAVEGGRPAPAPSPELLRAARWRASRHGMADTLVDVCARTARPAADIVNDLLARLRDDLAEHDEWDVVDRTIKTVLTHGTGSERQRDALRAGDFRTVVDMAVIETTGAVAEG